MFVSVVAFFTILTKKLLLFHKMTDIFKHFTRNRTKIRGKNNGLSIVSQFVTSPTNREEYCTH